MIETSSPDQASRAVPRVPGQHRAVAGEPACFVAESRYAVDHDHGEVVLSDLLTHTGAAFRPLVPDPRVLELDFSRAAFVDCETTGLAGGTGTYAFLIGVGYFVGGSFHVDQFFMRDPGEERGVLLALRETLGERNAVVTFNGKSFDWPLLETRHIYHRIRLAPDDPIHLDMLHPSRRLFKRRLGSCALSSLEVGVLSLPARNGDVPGWQIPGLYFDYLRRGDAGPLTPVFEHNRLDILTLAALTLKVARHATDPVAAPPEHALDLMCLGRAFGDVGDFEIALRCLERARAIMSEPDEEIRACVAALYKRMRNYATAADVWHALVAEGALSIEPYVELAKHAEHRLRDYARAAVLAEQALAVCSSRATTARDGRVRAELIHRLARLRRRQGIA